MLVRDPKRLGCVACSQHMRGYGDDGETAMASAIGGETAASAATQNPVLVGTFTGILIWAVTRTLDRLIGGGK